MKILNFSSILKLSTRGWYTRNQKPGNQKNAPSGVDMIYYYLYLLSYYDDEELQSYILGGPL